MRASLLLLAAPLVLATPAWAQTNAPPSNNPNQQFLDFAAQSNQSEIRAGLAASRKAQSPEVRAFARLTVLDHTELESQLAAVAAESHMKLPAGVSQAAEQQMSKMQSMEGSQFDDAYINAQIQDHQQAIQRFEQEKSNARDPGILAAASGALPLLQQHLALAKAVQASLKSKQASAK